MAHIPVTDHAVLRYLERVRGFDIEAVRKHIWKLCEGAAKVGGTCLRTEGVKFEFSPNGTVITVVPDGPLPGKTARERAQRKMARG